MTTIRDKKRYSLTYKHFYLPLHELIEKYENSALSIENDLVNPKVLESLKVAYKELLTQIESYR
jgi:hypothetical protein